MLGQPQFSLNQMVTFNHNGTTKIGKVFIIDKWGTFFDDSDVCYDIMVVDENCLYKHINERALSEYIVID